MINLPVGNLLFFLVINMLAYTLIIPQLVVSILLKANDRKLFISAQCLHQLKNIIQLIFF